MARKARQRTVRGSGTFGRRADGRHVWQGSLRRPDGSRWRPTVYGWTLEEVLAKRNALMADLAQHGTARPAAARTFGALAEQWWQTVAVLRVSPSTQLVYRSILDRHLLPTLAALPLARLDAPTIQALYAARRRAGLGSAALHLVHTVLRMVLAWAVQQGDLAANPCARATPGRRQVHEPVILDDPTGARALAAAWAAEPSLGLGAQLALGLTIRRGELLALRWADIDLEAGIVQITRTWARGAQGWYETVPKSTAGRRVLGLPPPLVALLRTAKARARSVYVVAQADGRPWVPNSFSTRWRRACTRAGLPPIRLHDLRHTGATWMLQDGAAVVEVQGVLGHSTPTMTMRYLHRVPGGQRAALERLAARIADTVGSNTGSTDAAETPTSGVVLPDVGTP